MLKVACIQLCSVRDVEQNLKVVTSLLAKAARAEARLVVLPENFAYMGGSEAEKRARVEDEANSSILKFLSQQALRHGIAIIGGTLLLSGRDGKIRNACPVFDAKGSLIALYDKIHLFDMDYRGESYHESALIEAGERPATVTIGGFKIGLSICYDLRFPELYRRYVDAGCQLLVNVAAFTAVTGAAHWQPLLRARAIENQCYMMAAAQWGKHADGRQTWGHSLVVDPWGEVVAELSEGEGFITADLSMQKLQQIRAAMPVLEHKKL